MKIWTKEDLMPHFFTGQSTRPLGAKGTSECYRHGVMTNLGDIELSEWKRLVFDLVKRNGDEAMLEQMKADAKTRPWLRTEKEIEQYALELYCSKSDMPEGMKNALVSGATPISAGGRIQQQASAARPSPPP